MIRLGNSEAYRSPSLYIHPQFYGVYLLQSEPKPKSLYVGSTPDPVRRLRQHNGILKRGGAYRTKRDGFRPWKMITIVYGFPSRISALQFEHSLQHAYETRHIKDHERCCSKQSLRYLPQKLASIRLLVKSTYFRSMNLKVVFFDQHVYDVWTSNKFRVEISPHCDVQLCSFEGFFVQRVGRMRIVDCINEMKALNNVYSPNSTDSGIPSPNTNLGNSLDLQCEIQNDYDLRDEGGINDNLQLEHHEISIGDIEEACYFERCKEQILFHSLSCYICKSDNLGILPDGLRSQNAQGILNDLTVRSFPLLGTCYYCFQSYHLTCLGGKFLDNASERMIIPLWGTCIACGKMLMWTKIARMATFIRGYALNDYTRPGTKN